MTGSQLILASSSPRRRELLTQAGLCFTVEPANIDEALRRHEAPVAYVQRLALEKASTLFALHPEAIILGADTTVVLDGQILNKPTDLVEAEQMLRALSGRTHEVHTGIAVISASSKQTHVETTKVLFTEISEADLMHYLSTNDSLDKAGGYGIQGYAARWITRIEGDFFNVVGLPIAATVRLLAAASQPLQS